MYFVVLFNYITFYSPKKKKKNWIGWVRVKVCLGFVWGGSKCCVVEGMDQKEEEKYFSIGLWWPSIRLNPLLHCWSVILSVKLRLVSFILVAREFYSSLAFIYWVMGMNLNFGEKQTTVWTCFFTKTGLGELFYLRWLFLFLIFNKNRGWNLKSLSPRHRQEQQ